MRTHGEHKGSRSARIERELVEAVSLDRRGFLLGGWSIEIVGNEFDQRRRPNGLQDEIMLIEAAQSRESQRIPGDDQCLHATRFRRIGDFDAGSIRKDAVRQDEAIVPRLDKQSGAGSRGRQVDVITRRAQGALNEHSDIGIVFDDKDAIHRAVLVPRD